ncbi:MAG TPA: ribonuclease HI family protein [Verrucomicrobiae bacterium]|nr:ribonuclease HI family protein [Verrucomicrobiae bacterium]
MSTAYKIYSDGGARGNPGPAAIGVLLCDPKGEMIEDHKEVIGNTTNNVAEYTAVLTGLDMAAAHGIQDVEYYVDSELVAKQICGEYRVKTPHILELFLKAKEKMTRFRKISFRHVPRTHEKIRYVDRLVNQALDEAASFPDLKPFKKQNPQGGFNF